MTEFTAYCPARGEACYMRELVITSLENTEYTLRQADRRPRNFLEWLGMTFNPQPLGAPEDIEAMRREAQRREEILTLNCNTPCIVEEALTTPRLR